MNLRFFFLWPRLIIKICFEYTYTFNLNLHLLKTVLPDGSEGSNTILTEINEDVHGTAIHGGTHEDIVVVVVGKDLLDSGGSTGLELLDGLFGGTVLLELVVDGLDVGCINELVSDFIACISDPKVRCQSASFTYS